jgi:L-ribulose-5-phosphate 3-epimerase
MVKSNHFIGIMQGRLTPSSGRGIQFFPFNNWSEEFSKAAEIGFSEIEFIFDEPDWENNPLMSQVGRKKITFEMENSGVIVNKICADYFMRKPLFGPNGDDVAKSVQVLLNLIEAAESLKVKLIEIPLVDNSSLESKQDQRNFIRAINPVLKRAETSTLQIGLETDLPPKKFLNLLERIGHPLIKANYDTGNSASLGYNFREEILTLGSYIANIHIKDRRYRGSTVTLGNGDADFDQIFQALKLINYRGEFVLQAARGDDEKEMTTTQTQKKFVENLIDKYLC